LNNVSWVLHDGVAYLFPSSANAHIINQTVKGNWRQINHQDWATEEPVQKDVFSLWVDHGTKPQNGKYEYIVVPGMEASAIDDYNKKSGISILANTADVQAVQHKDLERTEIVFYKAGSIHSSNGLTITVDSPCMAMVKTKGKTIEQIAISDPTRKLRSIELTVNLPIEAAGKNWKSAWNKEKKASLIHIDLPMEDYAGQTVVLMIGK
jgi:chondroitin AC lyase